MNFTRIDVRDPQHAELQQGDTFLNAETGNVFRKNMGKWILTYNLAPKVVSTIMKDMADAMIDSINALSDEIKSVHQTLAESQNLNVEALERTIFEKNLELGHSLAAVSESLELNRTALEDNISLTAAKLSESLLKEITDTRQSLETYKEDESKARTINMSETVSGFERVRTLLQTTEIQLRNEILTFAKDGRLVKQQQEMLKEKLSAVSKSLDSFKATNRDIKLEIKTLKTDLNKKISNISLTPGPKGESGFSGKSGYSGYSGVSGFSGANGLRGISGYSGSRGPGGFGMSGYSGYSGGTGSNGASGFSGYSGYSGVTGSNGASGFSGYSGVSGYSGTNGTGTSGFSGYSGYSGAGSQGSIDVTFDGIGNTLVANTKAYLVYIPYSGTITGWSIGADVSGSVVIDVWKDVFGNFPATVADAIFTTKPTLSSEQSAQNLSPTFIGAGATVTAGDTFTFNIDSATTVTKVNLSINITKS